MQKQLEAAGFFNPTLAVQVRPRMPWEIRKPNTDKSEMETFEAATMANQTSFWQFHSTLVSLVSFPALKV
jgi:hypothetical protein